MQPDYNEMKRILIVEDNTIMRKLIVNLFNEENIESREASNGLEGIRMVRELHFDLVITDIIMPKMEGIEFINLLKKDHPAIKIVAISGAKPYYLYMAKKLGTDGIFTKPLNRNSFLKHVKKLINI